MLRLGVCISLCFVVVMVLSGCSGNGNTPQSITPPISSDLPPPEPAPDTGLPVALPQDTLQPWEAVDSRGMVVPDCSARITSALDEHTEMVAGADRYLEGGLVSGNGEASYLIADYGSLSYAIYRISLGGDEPGVVTVDANLFNGEGYYVGLADYGRAAWQWHGPLTDHHVRLSTAAALAEGSSLISGLGSVFICVAACNEVEMDIVAVGAHPLDSMDTTPPPTPDAPALTPVTGGLLLEWMPVAAGDLAGYRICHADQLFYDEQANGVRIVDCLEGLTTRLLTGLTTETYLRISAVDTSGNESDLSELVVGEPLPGDAGGISVIASVPSGRLNESIILNAYGAEEYDIDVDGDGIYDITGDAIGAAEVDTTGTGIIRPRVRGSSGGGSMIALGGVSVIVTGNSRPLAEAFVDPASGVAPHTANFTGHGEDTDGSISAGGWDFDGDGTYDLWDDTDALLWQNVSQQYDSPGVFNARLKVVDDQDASDVDTVTVQVRKFDGFSSAFIRFHAHDAIGVQMSAAVVDGKPAVIYRNPGDNGLDYQRALDESGMMWGDPVAVNPATVAANQPALAVISGRPAVAYFDPTLRVVKYLYADDAAGSSWSDDAAVTISSGSQNVSSEIQLVEVAGNPAVAWLHLDALVTMYYRRASSAAGTGATAPDWADPPVAVVATDEESLSYPDLAVINDHPTLAYSAKGPFDGMKYIRASNTSGSLASDWPATPTEVCGYNPTTPAYCLIAVSGRPAIAMGDDSGVGYIRADDSNGDSWPVLVTRVAPSVGASAFLSMAVINGVPALAFQAHAPWSLGTLQYVSAVDSDGGAWTNPIIVLDQEAYQAGKWNTLLEINGLPHIAHQSQAYGAALFSRPRLQ